MMEPRRLLQQGATDAERLILRSAQADVPPLGSSERMLMAIENLTAGAGGPGAPAAAHAIKAGALAKVGLVAVVGLGALGAGALVSRLAGQGSVLGEKPRAPAVRLEAVAGAAHKDPVSTSPSFAATFEETNSVPLDSVRTQQNRPTGEMDESLGAEIRILDAARTAVDEHHPAAAQRALDSYARRFPQGRLQPEAAVLHLAVLVRRGDRAAARSLAVKLLADAAYNAYDSRIRSLLREIGE